MAIKNPNDFPITTSHEHPINIRYSSRRKKGQHRGFMTRPKQRDFAEPKRTRFFDLTELGLPWTRDFAGYDNMI